MNIQYIRFQTIWFILFSISITWDYSNALIPVNNISQKILENEIIISEVKCNQNGMNVSINFPKPFNGVIYSMGYYNQQKCRYVQGEEIKRNYNFNIPLNTCGTKSSCSFCDTKENIIIIQIEDSVDEIRDSARKIVCKPENHWNRNSKLLNTTKIFFNNDFKKNMKHDSNSKCKNKICKEECGEPCDLSDIKRSKAKKMIDLVQTTYDIETAEQILNKVEQIVGSVSKSPTRIFPTLPTEALGQHLTTRPQCYPGSADPRCPQPTTTARPQCYPGSIDPRCPRPTTTNIPPCYPGSTEPCPRPPTRPPTRPPARPSTRPSTIPPPRPPTTTIRELLICYPGSLDPKCLQYLPPNTKPTTPSSCYPGSPDPKCPQPFKPLSTKVPSTYLPPI